MTTAIKERGRIVASGMGGFLNPPTHPEHTHSVETDLDRRPCNRGAMCLSSAVECDWLADDTRAAAKKMLGDWRAPAIDSPEVVEWIRQVLGYFRGCYRGEGAEPECWHAGQLRIIHGDHASLPPIAEHAGVRMIREYYPAYVPTDDDFSGAYWGSKS